MGKFSAIATRSNGQVIDQTWFNLLQAAGEQLETSFELVKDGLQIPLMVMGSYTELGATTGVLYFTVKQDVTVTSAHLALMIAGSSGFTEVDVYRKRGADAFVSLFTTKPKVNHANGDFDTSNSGGSGNVAAVIDTTYEELQAGDVLRLDLTAVPTDSASAIADSFQLCLNYKVTGSDLT